MKIEIKVLNKEFYKREKMGGTYYDLPEYQTFGSAAVDLVTTEDVVLHPGETKMIATGVAIHIKDDNAAGMVLPRSGLGTKGLVLANTIGLIDSDYQGELKIAAWNRNQTSMVDTYKEENHIELKAGDRIAQILFMPVIHAQWDVVEEFSNKTGRGSNGFGSSG